MVSCFWGFSWPWCSTHFLKFRRESVHIFLDKFQNKNKRNKIGGEIKTGELRQLPSNTVEETLASTPLLCKLSFSFLKSSLTFLKGLRTLHCSEDRYCDAVVQAHRIVVSLEPVMITFSSYCRHKTEPVWPVMTLEHFSDGRSQICSSANTNFEHQRQAVDTWRNGQREKTEI